MAAFDTPSVVTKVEGFTTAAGMYASTINNGKSTAYALWMQYIPKFHDGGIKTKATKDEKNENGASWCNFAKE